MTYKTHKVGGAVAMLLAFEIMRTKGWVAPNINELVQLAVMYPAASWGSTALDLDHHINSVKEQTPFNLLCHKLLHLTHPKHRSWQTHSVLLLTAICIVLMLVINYVNIKHGSLGSFEWLYLRFILMGAWVGAMSHLFLDLITVQGVYLGIKKKFRLVPRMKFFTVDGGWEEFVRGVLYAIVVLLFLNILLRTAGINVFQILEYLK